MLSTAHLYAEYTKKQMEPLGIAENTEGHLIPFICHLSSLVSKLCETWQNTKKKAR